jgi:gamma-glutamyltranspeptidase/glutathione hydrolase
MDPFTWRTIMMKPTFLRWVAIAALMAGGTFSVAANPPAAPPVSYGVEEDVFHPVRATHGMVASVDALATRGRRYSQAGR